MPIVLCGDWNGSKRGQVYKFMRSQGFSSSFDTARNFEDETLQQVSDGVKSAGNGLTEVGVLRKHSVLLRSLSRCRLSSDSCDVGSFTFQPCPCVVPCAMCPIIRPGGCFFLKLVTLERCHVQSGQIAPFHSPGPSYFRTGTKCF